MFGSKRLSTSIVLGLALLGALALPAVSSGCGVSAASLCDRVCECEGCSEPERADCVDELEDNQRAAEAKGCADQYAALLDCYDGEFECREGDVDVDGCNPEEEALNKCLH